MQKFHDRRAVCPMMSLFKITLAIWCLVFPAAIFAQVKPAADLIYETGATGCEQVIAVQDALITQLADDPTATGYVVIYGPKSDDRRRWATKWYIDGQNEFRRFDAARLVAVRGREQAEFRIEFWKVPLGADKPDFGESDWDYRLPNATRPFVFYSMRDEVGTCPIKKWKDFANHLIANPEFRGHVVVFAGSNKAFRNEREEVRRKLVEEGRVSPAQLRFFFVREKTEYSQHELWLVPPRKK